MAKERSVICNISFVVIPHMMRNPSYNLSLSTRYSALRTAHTLRVRLYQKWRFEEESHDVPHEVAILCEYDYIKSTSSFA